LLGAGFAEAMNYSFFGDDELAALGLESQDVRSQARVVANPLAADQRLMRTSLVPGLLKALRLNVARKQSTVAMFEFGRVYLAEGETERLAVLATGSRLGNIADLRVWDFYDLKGLLETLVEPFALSGSWVLPSNPEPYLHPGVQAEWQVGGKTVAVLGQLHPRLTQDLNIETPVFLLDVNFEMVTRSAEQAHKYAPMPKFPAVHRDFAFLVDEQCRYGDVEAAIRSASEMMETVQLFDVYSGPQVPAGKRSVAVAVSYRAADRTLTEEEINAVDSRIISAVQAQTGGTLR
jgi:phenylalanyl-tRNA synthetase beta chain